MASIFHLLSLLFLTTTLLSPITTTAKHSLKPKALPLPVSKDPSTLQYQITHLNQRTPLISLPLTLHLGGPFLWVDCEQGYISSTYHPVHCSNVLCKLARAGSCGTCLASPKPGCNNNTCMIFAEQPIERAAVLSELAWDVLAIQSTDGSNPGKVLSIPRFPFICGDTFLLQGLASGVKGMAGLGWTNISLPSQLALTFRFSTKFAICLPSGTNVNGFVFFGDSLYNFLPNKEISNSLMHTSLIKNPVSTASSSFEGDPSPEYFIGVKEILINGHTVPFNSYLLSINEETGAGGTRISTMHPYTVLETSIYNAFVRTFVEQLSSVPRTAPVKPFEVCYSAKRIGSTRVGPAVPQIDLVLQRKGVYWRIFGANSMVAVSKNVLCLGFVEGVPFYPDASIVIGGYQLQDNLLHFDIARSRLAFSSSLLFRQTTCANFNFTSTV